MISYSEIKMIMLIITLVIDQLLINVLAQDTDEICMKTLAGYDGSDDLNILTIGMTRIHMLLVTKDYNVYAIKRDSMNVAINTLYLHKKSSPLLNIYPKLYNSKEWQDIQHYVYNSITLIDSYTDWFCFLTSKLLYPSFGLCYDLTHSRIIVGWRLANRFKEVTISSTRPGHFYTIRNKSDDNPSLQIASYNTSDSAIQDKTRIRLGEFRSICFDDKDTKQIRIPITSIWKSCSKPVEWSVMKGFVANGRFYLFTKESIYSFNEDVYDSPEESYPFQNHSYQSFFNCIGSPTIITTIVTTESNSQTSSSSVVTETQTNTMSSITTTHSTTVVPSSIVSKSNIMLAAIITAICLFAFYYYCYREQNSIQIESIYSSNKVMGKSRSGSIRIQNIQANPNRRRSPSSSSSSSVIKSSSKKRKTLNKKSKRSISNRQLSLSASGVSNSKKRKSNK
ncbi:uncharacterized protein LOC124496012 isoform X2 [Dermatophagoides farinae]|uniref:uncharacterized protein LOC124496012 isoform X2 n=1 Tax=Dermatophagoides farinae TaxID=6954 RepID=UPI003F615868